jgi:hypothetical protein
VKWLYILRAIVLLQFVHHFKAQTWPVIEMWKLQLSHIALKYKEEPRQKYFEIVVPLQVLSILIVKFFFELISPQETNNME